MNQALIGLLPSVAVVLFMFAVAYPVLWLYRLKQRRKKTPLTSDLLRSPGDSLRLQIDELNDEIGSSIFAVSTVPISLYAIWLTQVHFVDVKNPLIDAVIYALIGFLFLGISAVKLHKSMGRRQDLRLGLDCEQAVGQELNQLMLEGCHVYHDFMADGFNIDHIVIGPNGVFAIETKGRAKPDRGRGKEDVRVVYDGKSLQFPIWKETKPIEQAKLQAVWLSSWLKKATGDQIVVKPTLALPGWFVDRQAKDLLVYSGKNPKFIASLVTETPLSDDMIKRAVFQVEQKCRNIEPLAYKKQ